MLEREMIPARRRYWEWLKRSLGRRWREWRLPSGYIRLGTKYGGWWLDRDLVRPDPLLIDCGLGRDISFDGAFLSRFGGTVIGVEANPASLAWCAPRCPPGMHLRDRAFWTRPGETLVFHLPRPPERLPKGADGVSGSLLASHEYVAGGESRHVTTTSLEEVLAEAGREDCDVLKLDIEGAEYAVLEGLIARGLLGKCRQLLVEFHHGVTEHTLVETKRTVEAILAAGFRLAHIESRNYSFFQADLA
jgi:FkbM family methyltransferase